MVKFATNASGVIWWPNLELMQVEPPLSGEITQVLDAMLYPGSNVPLAMFVKKTLRNVKKHMDLVWIWDGWV